MYFVWRLILLINFLVVCKTQDWELDNEYCILPDGGVGICVPLSQCRPMVMVLVRKKPPVSPKFTQQINRYLCGNRDYENYVCCPSGPIKIEDDTPVRLNVNEEDKNQPPPDVSQHRNLNLLPEDCGYLDSTGDKIINGQNAQLNEFPWMALLSFRTSRGSRFGCGGTIISKRYILTAAHCLKDTFLLGIRVGEYNVGSNNDCEVQLDGTTKCTAGIRDLAIEEIIPHPEFNTTIISNDIGLIRVATDINFDVENVRPVCLPVGDLKDDVFKRVIVTGWGVTNIYTDATSKILQKVGLPVVDQEGCRKAYRNENQALITVKQLCAGGQENKSSCNGDSGGPVHVVGYFNEEPRYIQHGIVSFGVRECSVEGIPGVYTRVAYYMDWILDNMRQ